MHARPIRPRRRHGRRAFPRGGFSLVELLTACVVLTCGVLALARITAAVITLESIAHRRTLAAEVMRSRLEMLHGTRCRPAAGRDSAPGIVTRWLADTGGGVGTVVDSADVGAWPGKEPLRTRVLSAAPC